MRQNLSIFPRPWGLCGVLWMSRIPSFPQARSSHSSTKAEPLSELPRRRGNSENGTLFALDPATGQPLTKLATGDLPHFASPTLGGNRAYLGTLHGVIAVSGA